MFLNHAQFFFLSLFVFYIQITRWRRKLELEHFRTLTSKLSLLIKRVIFSKRQFFFFFRCETTHENDPVPNFTRTQNIPQQKNKHSTHEKKKQKKNNHTRFTTHNCLPVFVILFLCNLIIYQTNKQITQK